MEEQRRGVFDDLPYDVDHKEHGWVKLGDFYFWTKRAVEDHRRGVPVQERRDRTSYPKELSASHIEHFDRWEKSRGAVVARKQRGGNIAMEVCAYLRRRDWDEKFWRDAVVPRAISSST